MGKAHTKAPAHDLMAHSHNYNAQDEFSVLK